MVPEKDRKTNCSQLPLAKQSGQVHSQKPSLAVVEGTYGSNLVEPLSAVISTATPEIKCKSSSGTPRALPKFPTASTRREKKGGYQITATAQTEYAT